MQNQIVDDKEIVFAVEMANPKFRGAVIPEMKDMNWSSPMAKKIVDFFVQPEMDGQPFIPKALYTHLAEEFIKPEIQGILNACMEVVQNYRDDTNDIYTNQTIKSFKFFYQNRVVQEIMKDASSQNVEKVISRIIHLRDISSKTIPVWSMGDLDVDKVMEEDSSLSGIPSNFGFVKRACPEGIGYSTGEVCMVCAPPGGGKTLFLAHEVVAMMRHNMYLDEQIAETENEELIEELENQRIRVFWLAAGDMKRIDFMRRMSAIYLGVPLSEAHNEVKKYYNDEISKIFKDVHISVVPAAYVDAYGIKHFVDTQLTKQNPNVIIIDYDANVQTTKGDDMYKAGEEIYNVATALARPVGRSHRLVFVASQPKIQFWDARVIPMEAAAESSRKQAVIDRMITIGRDGDCGKNHCGIMMMAKMRRGKVGEQDRYQQIDGHMIVIDKDKYNTLVESSSNSKKRGGYSKQWDGYGR